MKQTRQQRQAALLIDNFGGEEETRCLLLSGYISRKMLLREYGIGWKTWDALLEQLGLEESVKKANRD